MELCATLAGRPWRLSRDDILRLDRRWVREVLFAARDDKGGLRREPADGPPPREQWRQVWRERGYPEHMVDAMIRGL